ncbi:hypothetical protein MLP_49910 [Microlunatus phosphovorus NM-1]|uniref:Uncharacterized protein n=1 Tax=Microlunatus phosphovorus (strain ATCC 700054 / DSM 10555 / JCM 9379 / NBRC 101784 / NCIMB 13414 / VKM Ac-1990 / NM-1) TaxID=1032480 RepID=F5XG71_MICPN|nr:hypothetical protein MLP_49910 [Microlunatus phosphovorus NM-1]
MVQRHEIGIDHRRMLKNGIDQFGCQLFVTRCEPPLPGLRLPPSLTRRKGVSCSLSRPDGAVAPPHGRSRRGRHSL